MGLKKGGFNGPSNKVIKFYHKVHPKCIHGNNKTAKHYTVERFLLVEHTGLELISVCRLFGKKSTNQGL